MNLKIIVFSLGILTLAQGFSALADHDASGTESERKYVQMFAHYCTQVDYKDDVDNHFVIRSLVDQLALEKKGLNEFFSIENKQAGNGDYAMAISVVQSPSEGADIVQVEQKIEGCNTAKSFIEGEEQSTWFFECAADGDAGHGEFSSVTTEEGNEKFTAKLKFPEGSFDLLYPIEEGSEFNLSCRQTE